MVVLISAVAAALGLAASGPVSERGLSPHPAEAHPRWDPPERLGGASE